MKDLEAHEKLVKARTRMCLSLPFIAGSVMVLDLIEDSSIQTAETDGNYIYYNPVFVSSLSLKECMWLLAHESLHCVLLHHTRVNGRDFKLWNIAADYVINLILEGISQFSRISGVMFDLNFSNMATEEVYNIINQMSAAHKQELKDGHSDPGGFRKAQSSGQGKPQDSKKKDQKSDSKDKIKNNSDCNSDDKNDDQSNATSVGSQGKTGKEESGKNSRTAGNDDEYKPFPTDVLYQEEKWQIFSKQAMDIAEKISGSMMGFGSANLKRLIEKIVNPTVPWEQLLYIFVDQTAREEYDWNRPNKRYVPWGMYLPTLYNVKLGYMAVVIDTSGSIKESDLNRFASEIHGIRTAYECKVMVIYCDAAINEQSIQIFEEEDEIILRPTGGGGTDFRPPFTYIEKEELDTEIRCLMYFTDGACNRYPKIPPDYPVLWVGLKKFVPEFGDFVLMESI